MPGLAQRNDQSSNATSSCHSLSGNNGSVSANGFWSKHGGDISYNQLQKFWSELSPSARHELLKVDKQTLFEQARKNMYCSRCNGLLLEGFMQIVMYGKSLQQEATGGQLSCYELGVSKDLTNGGSCGELTNKDDLQDPSVHPWGGLTTTRDGVLTLLDCYLYSKSLMGIQNVFDSARARERERELLYPDACGGGGRGWISQGMVTYGRGHGTRETCALHTARLSCDTLVDFWSALGDETRQSLLRMKEEDFIERLIYRFDSKRFCRDCRRNVIREFKELKELKRMKREPRCTTWFCAADASFQYEVSDDTIHADWHQTFADSVGTYHHFEWAVGTGEGKSDILDYENVGMNGSVQINGLDLGGFSACYITLRAWKMDGRCTELSVKAHALEGEQCVHSRLMVGDGYVTISYGEDITTFFEHAEEAEEDEDDNSMDRDGNELDSECSRPQKHAKSPELAREFLLDAATVIFKEQVEKAFREGTARQNAHSIFVCLAVKLLEERVHVACKEIVTLEKQMKLLEEEEKEKREEEERKERKRIKEREKKLRRKERLRGKDKMKNCVESNTSVLSDVTDEVSSPHVTEETDISMEEMAAESADPISNIPATPDTHNVTSSNVVENIAGQEENDWSTMEDPKLPRQNLKVQSEFQLCSSRRRPDRHRKAESGSTRNKPECSSRGTNELNKQSRPTNAKFSSRNCGPRFDHKLQCTSSRMTGRNDLHSCSCDQHSDYREKAEPHGSIMKLGNRYVNKTDSASNSSKPVHCTSKLNQTEYTQENCGKSKTKIPSHISTFSREPLHTKKVWEPVEPQKRYARCNSDSDVTLRASSLEGSKSDDTKKIADNVENSNEANEEIELRLTRSCKSTGSPDFSASSSASSDNCSSCLSEGENNTASSNMPTQESSSTSDSEDGSQLSEGRESLVHPKTEFAEPPVDKVQNNYPNRPTSNLSTSAFPSDVSLNFPWNPVPKILNQQNLHYPAFQAPPMMGYYQQNQRVSWPTTPTNGFVPYAQPNPYMFTSPFSYGLGTDPSYCMQYTPQFPPYQPPVNPNPCGVLNPRNDVRRENPVQTEQKPSNFHNDTGFSLFQFAGPVPRALSAIRSSMECSDEELSGDHSPEGDKGDGNPGMEEYNLFAASKGIEFSIF